MYDLHSYVKETSKRRNSVESGKNHRVKGIQRYSSLRRWLRFETDFARVIFQGKNGSDAYQLNGVHASWPTTSVGFKPRPVLHSIGP